MDKQFVSSYPLPPIYYKDFNGDDNDMKPPSLDIVGIENAKNMRNMCYGSSVQTHPLKYNQSIDYKLELSNATTKLLEALCNFADLTSNTPKTLNKAINTTTEASIIIANAMSLTEQSTTSNTRTTTNPKQNAIVSFDEKLACVNEHIALVQQLINEFKEQQAREDMCKELEKQLAHILSVEETLTKVLNESKAALSAK